MPSKIQPEKYTHNKKINSREDTLAIQELEKALNENNYHLAICLAHAPFFMSKYNLVICCIQKILIHLDKNQEIDLSLSKLLKGYLHFHLAKAYFKRGKNKESIKHFLLCIASEFLYINMVKIYIGIMSAGTMPIPEFQATEESDKHQLRCKEQFKVALAKKDMLSAYLLAVGLNLFVSSKDYYWNVFFRIFIGRKEFVELNPIMQAVAYLFYITEIAAKAEHQEVIATRYQNEFYRCCSTIKQRHPDFTKSISRIIQRFNAPKKNDLVVTQQSTTTAITLPAATTASVQPTATTTVIAAINNDSETAYALARSYRFGFGRNVDQDLCVYWYEHAVAEGELEATNVLGWFYQYGLYGVKVDLDRSVELFRAAQNHSVTASFNLAWCYENNRGVDPDPANLNTAFQLYTKAADQNNIFALCHLIWSAEKNNNLFKIDAATLEKYKKMRDAHDEAAVIDTNSYLNGLRYEYGHCGVKQDKAKAKEEYKKGSKGSCATVCLQRLLNEETRATIGVARDTAKDKKSETRIVSSTLGSTTTALAAMGAAVANFSAVAANNLPAIHPPILAQPTLAGAMGASLTTNAMNGGNFPAQTAPPADTANKNVI